MFVLFLLPCLVHPVIVITSFWKKEIFFFFAFFGLWHEYCLSCPASILRKSISGRHRPVRVADGPMTARYRFT